eukprot:m.37189 g.37189  ORF g.37189 m.37189 type:complete len:146 (+) comp10082_c0_seq1:89-526(+)
MASGKKPTKAQQRLYVSRIVLFLSMYVLSCVLHTAGTASTSTKHTLSCTLIVRVSLPLVCDFYLFAFHVQHKHWFGTTVPRTYSTYAHLSYVQCCVAGLVNNEHVLCLVTTLRCLKKNYCAMGVLLWCHFANHIQMMFAFTYFLF